jgi:hypothetical protein
MRVILRHTAIAALPLLCGLAAGWAFAELQRSCWDLVGPILSAKCHGVKLRYQIAFQTGGTAVGSLIAAIIGIGLERRRMRRASGVTGAAVSPPAP